MNLISVLAFAGVTAFTPVDDPKLLEVARADLQQTYPTLTANDLDNLQGMRAASILRKLRGESENQTN